MKCHSASFVDRRHGNKAIAYKLSNLVDCQEGIWVCWRARAITLCGSWTGLAEEQAQPVIIVESGAESATADAVARRAIVAQHVQRHATDQGQVFGGMVLAGLASILAELHVQDPVLLVFDA